MIGLDYFKDFIGVSASNTAQDTRLQIYLDAATKVFCSEVGRDIVQTTYPAASEFGRGDDGYYSGNGRRELLLRQRPVIATGLAVYLDASGRFGQNPDGSFDSTTTLLVYGTDYVLRTDGCLPGTSTKCSYCGILERVGTVWSAKTAYTPGQLIGDMISGQGNIKVVYTAGFPTVPYDVRMAVCQIAAFIRRQADKGVSVNSESLGGYSYSVGQQAVNGQTPEMGGVRKTVLDYKGVRL